MRYLIVLLLAGCAQTARLVDIDYSVRPPADWPALEERIMYGEVEAVQRWCNMGPDIRRRAFNCAVYNFYAGICTIYLSDRTPSTLEHERAHCRGYNHVGDPRLAHEAWAKFKRERVR